MVRGRSITIAAVLLCAAAGAARAQEPKSAALAKQLSQLLDQKKLDAVAAPDPQNAGVYAAALYFSGTQMLVVSAKYSAPQLMNDKLAKKNYRDVYIDLSSASVPGSKTFVIDLNCDGLQPKASGDEPGDSYEHGDTHLAFEGSKKAKMKDEDYDKTFAEADAAYAQMLQLLINELKTSGA